MSRSNQSAVEASGAIVVEVKKNHEGYSKVYIVEVDGTQYNVAETDFGLVPKWTNEEAMAAMSREEKDALRGRLIAAVQTFQMQQEAGQGPAEAEPRRRRGLVA